VILLSESETRDLAELKKDLEERIAKTERDISLLRLSLKLVDEVLVKVSFKPASKLIEQQAQEQPKPVAEIKAASPKPVEQRFVEPKMVIPRAADLKPAVAAHIEEPQIESEEQGFPIKSKTGDDLGVLFVGTASVKIVPRSDLRFSSRTPPFQSFFVDRVIGEMRRKDEMAVDAGSKDPMAMIEHEIILDGDIKKKYSLKT
jgi:hypothetical protein